MGSSYGYQLSSHKVIQHFFSTSFCQQHSSKYSKNFLEGTWAFPRILVLEETTDRCVGLSQQQTVLTMIFLWKNNTGRKEPACSGRAGRKELTGQGTRGENVWETGDRDKLIKNTESQQEEMGGQMRGNTNKNCEAAEMLLFSPSRARYLTLILPWSRPDCECYKRSGTKSLLWMYSHNI